MVLQKQQELEAHLQTADEVCRLGQEDSVLLIDALEREDKLRVSSCHIKCGGGGGGQKHQIMEGVTLGEWSSKGY